MTEQAETHLTLFVEEVRVSNNIATRFDNLVTAASWIVKSMGEQTVPYFIAIDPDHPPTQDQIDIDMLNIGSGLVSEAARVRQEKIKKGLNAFREASQTDAVIDGGLMTRASAERQLDGDWLKFQSRIRRNMQGIALNHKLNNKEKEDRVRTQLEETLRHKGRHVPNE